MSNQNKFQSEAIPEFKIPAGGYNILDIIKDPKYNSDPEIQRQALALDWKSIKYFQAPRAEWLESVKTHPSLWISCPYNTEIDFYTIALFENPDLITMIKNPSDNMILVAIRRKPGIISQLAKTTEVLWITALTQDPSLIVNYPGDIPAHVLNTAIRSDPSVIRFLTTISESVAFNVMQADVSLVRYLVGKIQEPILKKIVTLYPACLEHIWDQTAAIQLAAIQSQPNIFKWCKPLFPEVVKCALELDPRNIKWVQDQTMDMARNALAKGVPPSSIHHSILMRLAEEKRSEARKGEMEREAIATKKRRDELEKMFSEMIGSTLVKQESFQLTKAQKELLPRIMLSDLPSDVKGETIKLLLQGEKVGQ